LSAAKRSEKDSALQSRNSAEKDSALQSRNSAGATLLAQLCWRETLLARNSAGAIRAALLGFSCNLKDFLGELNEPEPGIDSGAKGNRVFGFYTQYQLICILKGQAY